METQVPETIKTNLIETRRYYEISTSDQTPYSERRKIVLEAYDLLLKKHGGIITVYNEFLGCTIEITRKVSRKKASNNTDGNKKG